MSTVSETNSSSVENYDSENSLFSEGISLIGEASSEEINLKELVIGKIIGLGAFGVVVAAYDPSSEKFYAVKKIINRINDPEFKESIIKELEFARSLKHENIAKVYDTYTSDNSGYIIMDLCTFGNLFDYIEENFPLKMSLLKSFTRDMVSAVKYLHDHKIAHQDIKSRNFLLDENLMIKLCDFGFMEKYTGRSNSKDGTVDYLSPQLAFGDSDPLKSDIWALGITFFEMATSDIPDECKFSKMLYNSERQFQITCPSSVTWDFADLIKKMLAYNENDRIDINEVASHIWFDGQLNTNCEVTEKAKLVGLIVTDAISSLQEFDYFCETDKSKSSVCFAVKFKEGLLTLLLKDVFENQQITYQLVKNKIEYLADKNQQLNHKVTGTKFHCKSNNTSQSSFIAEITKSKMNKNNSTINFIKKTGSQNDFFILLKNILKSVVSND